MPGNHCGSTALRNSACLPRRRAQRGAGVRPGRGACFLRALARASRFTNGRTSRLAEQFVELTGGTLGPRTFEDSGASWDAASATVSGGAPPSSSPTSTTSTTTGRRPTSRGTPCACGLRRRGRVPLRHCLRGTPDHDHREPRRCAPRSSIPCSRSPMFVADNGIDSFDPRSAAPTAVRCAERMLEPPLGEYEGLPGSGRCRGFLVARAALRLAVVGAVHVPDDRAPRDPGGGNFRLMYSRFLDEAGTRRRPSRRPRPSAGHWPGICSPRATRTSSAALWARIGTERARC